MVLFPHLFIAEAHYTLDQQFEERCHLFERETDKRTALLLVNWLAQMAIHGRIEKENFATLGRVYRDSLEAKTMLQTALLKEKEIIYNSGKDEGKRERNCQHIQRRIAKGYTLPVIADLLGFSENDM